MNTSWLPVLSSQKSTRREGERKPPEVHCRVEASAWEAENPVPGSSARAALLPLVGAAAPPTATRPLKLASAV